MSSVSFKVFKSESIDTLLVPDTKSLVVTLEKNLINEQTITELETLCDWLEQHIEVHSVYIHSAHEKMNLDISLADIDDNYVDTVNNYNKNIQKIAYRMFGLPQTFIMDLGKESSSLGLELSIGADIRICHESCVARFDHLKKGLVPSAGGIGFLGAIIPKSTAREWVLSSRELSVNEMKEAGFIHYFSPNTRELSKEIMKRIRTQSAVARIQTKSSMFETIKDQLEKAIYFEPKFSKASLTSGDYRKYLESQDHKSFIKARDFRQEI